MSLPWNRPKQADPLRGIVLANLHRLQNLFRARGRRLDFDPASSTQALETGLWNVIDTTAADMGLAFAPGMACEARISEIIRNLPPLASRGQWPFAR